jgi:TfoX/Sxy family transcriptional regulator of competence genes
MMKWVKIPKENHPLFLDALPHDARVSTPINMFGGIAAKVNGHMAMGLWAKSVMVRVGQKDHDEAIAMGAVPFDPMGRGAHDTAVVLPDDFIGRTEELREWMMRAVEYCARLPAKEKGAVRKVASKTAASKKAASRKAAPKKKAAKAATKKKKR